MKCPPRHRQHPSPPLLVVVIVAVVVSTCFLLEPTNGFTFHPTILQATKKASRQVRHNRRSSTRWGVRGGASTTTISFSAATLSSTADTEEEPEVDRSQYDLTLFSPCKINLFLRILRRRPDNYHDLASLFQTIGFGDTLHLKLLPPSSTCDEFKCNMDGVPTDDTNLVIRAFTLMREKTGLKDKFFGANLVKQVPAQAGLGGGSGNAATAMWGVNELLGRPATLEQLVEWSADLGSDITFFLSRGSAYCTGRGEIMTPINPPPFPTGTKLTIIKPDIGLSTPQVFKNLNYDELSSQDPEKLLQQFITDGVNDIDDAAYVNDLELPAFRCVPQLKELKDELLDGRNGFEHVMMSGSGTSIFCIGEASNQEEFMNNFGEREGISVYPTEFINREEGTWFE